MSKFTSKDNQDKPYENHQSLNDAEERKLENVNQTLLNGDSNFTNSRSHHLVNLCKKTILNNDKYLQKYNDVALTGIKRFVFV